MRSVVLPNLAYRLTTAEILYHLPDHPHVLQSFLWQQMDLAPDFPRLRNFLDYWRRDIEGKLHSVTVAQTGILDRAGPRHPGLSLSIH